MIRTKRWLKGKDLRLSIPEINKLRSDYKVLDNSTVDLAVKLSFMEGYRARDEDSDLDYIKSYLDRITRFSESHFNDGLSAEEHIGGLVLYKAPKNSDKLTEGLIITPETDKNYNWIVKRVIDRRTYLLQPISVIYTSKYFKPDVKWVVIGEIASSKSN